MKTISSKPSLTSDSFQLTELLATNKSLAQEKRQVHRQKLRQYSEKAVKIKQILRSSADQSEKKCLEGKLRALEEKQNAEINKLSKIDQIEKEIDQYMHEQDSGQQAHGKKPQPKYTVEQLQNEYTPAKKLRKIAKQVHNSDQMSNLEFSMHSNNLFASSQFNMGRNPSDKKMKALHVLNQNDLYTREDEKKKILSKESRAYSCWEPSLGKTKANPLIAYTLEEHQPKITKNTQLRYEQEKLANLKKQHQKKEKAVSQLQKKIEQLIDRQRNLMQRIDGLEKEHSHLVKKTSSFVNSIHRSKDIILSSGLLLEQLVQMQNFAHFKQKSSHQFSIDSLESYAQSDNPHYGISVQLSNFQRLLEQFLLSAERVTMITSGELQQCGLKATRMKEDCTMLQGKKRSLQIEITRCEQNSLAKKKQFKMLEEACNHLNTQSRELDQISEVKKKLIAELQEKCEKMKSRKKGLTQKLQRAENQFQSVQSQYSKRSKDLDAIKQSIESYSTKQEQMEQSFIFTERKLQSLRKQQKSLQANKMSVETKIKEATICHQKILIQIGEDQKRIVQLKSQIADETLNLTTFQERASKIQKQLQESTDALDEQRNIIASQNEQINSKSNELLQSQKKIIAVADSMRAIQAQNAKLTEKIKCSHQEIDELKLQKEQTLQAKEELQDILREIMLKKQALIEELELRSEELSTLLTDLMDAHNQLTAKTQQYIQVSNNLKDSQEQLQKTQAKMEQTKQQLEQLMEEENNMLGRITKLKQAEKQLLLQAGLKGNKAKIDEQLKQKIAQAVTQMQNLEGLKCQLKECKYENRKLKLDNQRLLRLTQIQPNNDKQYKS